MGSIPLFSERFAKIVLYPFKIKKEVSKKNGILLQYRQFLCFKRERQCQIIPLKTMVQIVLKS